MAVLTTERRARSTRICAHCRGWIQRGQRYESHAVTPHDAELGNADGTWYRFATHKPEDCR